MRLIVIAGHSGGGKTHTRTHDPRLADLPCVDLGDVVTDIQGTRADSFEPMMRLLAKRIMACNADQVVVEGHFLPRSKSRQWLKRWMHMRGHESEWIDITTDNPRINMERLRQDMDNGKPRAAQRIGQLRRDIRKYGFKVINRERAQDAPGGSVSDVNTLVKGTSSTAGD